MPELSDLPGVKAKKVVPLVVKSRTAAIQGLRDGYTAVLLGGDNGSITVWKDDDGHWRCEFHRFLRVLSSKQFVYLAAVDAWLRDWIPGMHNSGN